MRRNARVNGQFLDDFVSIQQYIISQQNQTGLGSSLLGNVIDESQMRRNARVNGQFLDDALSSQQYIISQQSQTGLESSLQGTVNDENQRRMDARVYGQIQDDVVINPIVRPQLAKSNKHGIMCGMIHHVCWNRACMLR